MVGGGRLFIKEEQEETFFLRERRLENVCGLFLSYFFPKS